jgi:hypothetical protein
MLKMNKFKRILFFIIACGCFICPTLISHTIYISGPPVNKNRKWFKHSKLLYDTIKSEIESKDETCELFPKKFYRDSVQASLVQASLVETDLSGTDLSGTDRGDKFYSKKELVRVWQDKERLLEDLFMLIVKRHRELEEEFESSGSDLSGYDDDNRIRLMAHGSGGELLLMLKDSPYANLVRSYVVFDGSTTDQSGTDESGTDESGSVGNTEKYDITSSSYDEESGGDIIGLALRSDGNLVVNFDLKSILGNSKSGHGAEIVTLVTALAGLIGAILALL